MAAEDLASPQRHEAPIRFWLLLGILVLAELTCALGSTMMNVAFGHLYGLYDPALVSWTMTAFTLSAAASAAICGRLGDLYGRVRVMKIMLAVSLCGSLVGLFAPNLSIVILARGMQGASMALLPLGLGVLRQYAPPNRLDIGVGVIGGTFSFGAGLGFLLGGMIVDGGHWQNIFALTAGVALTALLLITVLLPKDQPRLFRAPLDMLGGILFVVPLTTFLLGLRFAARGDGAIGYPAILLGAAGLAIWARHEWRHPDPLIDVRLLARPGIGVVNALVFFMAMGSLSYPQVVLPMLQQPLWTGVGLGFSATLVGLIKFPSNIYAGFVGIGAGYLAQRITMRRVLVIASAGLTIAWVAMTLKHDSALVVWGILLVFVVPTLTIQSAFAPGLIAAAAPPDRVSEATGLTQVIRAIGDGIGSQVVGLILASSMIGNGTGKLYPDGRAYMIALGFIAAATAMSLLLAQMVPKQPARDVDR